MAEMELTDASVEAKTQYLGNDRRNVPAGKTFKIETSPQGEAILTVEVLEGKIWDIKTHIEIIETDA